MILATAIAVGSWVLAQGGAWSPALEQVNEIRGGIELLVKHEASERKIELPDWSQYSFTYQGQMSGDRKFILVNAFCTPLPEKETIVAIAGGGPCYFSIKYDVKKKQFFELLFNATI